MIVLIEDDDLIRSTLGDALDDAGLKTRSYPDAEAALASIGTDRPELVVTDILLGPGMNGFELGKAILSLYPDTQLIYMSGYTNSAAQQVIGPHEIFLAKPFGIDTFIGLVASLLVPSSPP